jgi:hypothetical protein
VVVHGLRDEPVAGLEVDRAVVVCGDVSATLCGKRGGAAGLSVAYWHGVAAAAREVVGCVTERDRAFVHRGVGSDGGRERDGVAGSGGERWIVIRGHRGCGGSGHDDEREVGGYALRRRHGDAGGGAGGVRDVTGPVGEAVTGVGRGRQRYHCPGGVVVAGSGRDGSIRYGIRRGRQLILRGEVGGVSRSRTWRCHRLRLRSTLRPAAPDILRSRGTFWGEVVLSVCDDPTTQLKSAAL